MKRMLSIILFLTVVLNSIVALGATPVELELIINGERQESYSISSVFIENGNNCLMASVDGISEALGAHTVKKDNTATVVKGSTMILFTGGSKTANVDGKVIEMDVPARIVNGELLVPAEFLGKQLGYHTFKEREGFRVRIVSKTSTTAPAVSTELIPGMAQLDSELLKVHRPVPTTFTKPSELKVENLIFAKTDYTDVRDYIVRPENPTIPDGEVLLSMDGFIEKMDYYASQTNPSWIIFSETDALENAGRISMNVKMAGQTIGEADNGVIPFKKALRFDVRKASPNNLGNYPIGIYPAVPAPEVKDQYVLTFWARLISGGSDEAEKGSFCIQMQNSEWKKTVDANPEFGKEWTRFDYLLTGYKDACNLRILPTKYKQVFEIGGFQITDVGQDADVSFFDKEEDLLYKELEPDAPWRAEALERIEEIRKGDFTVIVKDKNGNPVPNADITFDMFEHDFKFGVQQDTESVEDIYWADYQGLDGNGDKEKELRERRGALFNSLSVGNRLKWQSYAKDKMNNPDLPSTASVVIDRAHEDGIKYVRGHALWMPSNATVEHPQELYDLLNSDNGPSSERYAKFLTMVEDHFTEMNNNFPEIYEWDVTNETRQRPYFTNEFTHLQPNSDPNYIFKDVYEIAARTLTNGQKLMLCDNAQFEEQYWERLDWFRDHGIKYDSLGMQGHSKIGSKDVYNNYRPEKWLEVWDRFAYENHKTFAVTEFSVGALNDEYGQAGQGDYMRDIVIAAFSHPACTGFNIWWMADYWCDWDSPFAVNNYQNKEDGAGVSPLYTNSFTEKPGVAIFKDLLYNKWWTRGAKATTNASGRGTVNGYFGDYDITVKVGGKETKVMAAFHKGYENVLEITVE